MAARYLGPFFDIHCGGEDHIPVHHTNEIAQTQACYGTRLANFWMHGYFLQLDDTKMAKSAGDFLRLQTLIDQGYDPLAYRYFCLGGHYRSKLTFSWEGMDSATAGLRRLRGAYASWDEGEEVDEEYLARFKEEINADLNMPRALALAWELTHCDLAPAIKKGTMDAFDCVLGLGLAEWSPREESIPAEVVVLVERRQQARAEKRWADADALRDEIAAAGFEVRDTPEGPQVTSVKG
jgi:cysteinyl-tRNA synthetase